MNTQNNGRFDLLVRPVTTVNVVIGKLSAKFEADIRSSISRQSFSSPTTGVLVLPIIIDSSIVVPPTESVRYVKRDNSVTTATAIDFVLWQSSSEFERLKLLSGNVRCSLDKVQPRYLLHEDREKLLIIVNSVQARLAPQLLN